MSIAGATLSNSWRVSAQPTSTVASAVYRGAYLQPNQTLVYTQPAFQPDATGNVPDGVYQPVAVNSDLIARTRAALPTALQVDLSNVRAADGRQPHYQLDTFDAGSNFGPTPLLAVASPELLELFKVGPAARRRLHAGDVVVVRSPGVTRRPIDGVDHASGATILRVGAVVESPEAALALPRILIGEERARELHWQTVPAGATIFSSRHDLTSAERTQLELINADLQWQQIVTDPPPPGSLFQPSYIEVGAKPSPGITAFQIRLLGFALAAVLVLGVVGLGLGLAARDSRDETAVLDAVGAHPRVRRQVGTRRALLLVMVACAVALPAGLLPVAAMITASTSRDLRFQMDWPALFALAALLPAVVGVASAAGGWLRDRLAPAHALAFNLFD